MNNKESKIVLRGTTKVSIKDSIKTSIPMKFQNVLDIKDRDEIEWIFEGERELKVRKKICSDTMEEIRKKIQKKVPFLELDFFTKNLEDSSTPMSCPEVKQSHELKPTFSPISHEKNDVNWFELNETDITCKIYSKNFPCIYSEASKYIKMNKLTYDIAIFYNKCIVETLKKASKVTNPPLNESTHELTEKIKSLRNIHNQLEHLNPIDQITTVYLNHNQFWDLMKHPLVWDKSKDYIDIYGVRCYNLEDIIPDGEYLALSKFAHAYITEQSFIDRKEHYIDKEYINIDFNLKIEVHNLNDIIYGSFKN